MTIREVPVWEIFASAANPNTLLELFEHLGVTDITVEEQLDVIFNYIDSPLWLSASDNLMNEVNEFIYDYIEFGDDVSASFVQAEFNEDQPRDENGKWVGSGVSFAKTQCRARLQALANQARAMVGLNTNATVMVSINKIPQGSTTIPYADHSNEKDHGHWEDMATASDNDAVKTQGAIVFLEISGTKDNFTAWIGTGKESPILLAMNGVNLYNADGTPNPNAPAVPTLTPKLGSGKSTGMKTPESTLNSPPSVNDYHINSYSQPEAVAQAKIFGDSLEKSQIAAAHKDDNSQYVHAGKLKFYLCANIATRMGDKYDAQIFPEVRVFNNAPGVTPSYETTEIVSSVTLMSKDDVWEKREGAFGSYGKPEYTYLGKIGEQEIGRPSETNTFGIQPSNNVTITNIPGDSPEVATSLRETSVSSLVQLWAQSSNDTHAISLAVQNAAIKEFGLTNTKTWNKGGDALKLEIQKVTDAKGEALQAFVRAQYEITQDYFKSQGIEKVTLFRGFTTSKSEFKVKAGSPVKVQMRPLSSFSYNHSNASSFSDGSVIIAGDIPVENILSTALTGVGCQHESEVVVIGGTNIYTLDRNGYSS